MNPLIPVDLVVDHSVQVDAFASGWPCTINSAGSSSATRSVTSSSSGVSRRSPTSGWCRPATGIVHQVNLEYLAQGRVWDDGHGRSTRTAWSAPTATPR